MRWSRTEGTLGVSRHRCLHACGDFELLPRERRICGHLTGWLDAAAGWASESQALWQFDERRKDHHRIGCYCPSRSAYADRGSAKGVATSQALDTLKAEPVRTFRKPQPGGNFVLGSRDYYRGYKHDDHKSRCVHGERIRRAWAVVFGGGLLQPTTHCGAEEVERNGPSCIRVGANCRRTRAHRQSPGGSCDCRGDAASGSGATASTARVARYSVFHVWALKRGLFEITGNGVIKTAPLKKREGMRHSDSFQTCLPPAWNRRTVFSRWAG